MHTLVDVDVGVSRVSESGQRAREKLAMGAITGLFNLGLPAGGTERWITLIPE